MIFGENNFQSPSS